MRRAIIPALAALLAATPAGAAPVDEWRDLHGRCVEAVRRGTALDTEGLEERPPTLIADVVPEPPFGVRLEYDVLRTSQRLAPRGIWARRDGRFEMQLLDYPTRAGSRSICEVSVARGAPPLTRAEAAPILDAFRDLRREAVAEGRATVEDDGHDRLRTEPADPNPRGCPVIVSVTFTPGEDFFRSSAAEGPGAPDCGGVSLSGSGGLNPAQVLNGAE
ncbi:hypothetical protein [uncultured Jannaschia sp.]|uniref:hypothetical protein n=1 Tax=uncultured Jannaschia sp. TaxID=293347 RepID=UPI002621220D|nr:hypothetical protein [uncultured Jannaschia sp.]